MKKLLKYDLLYLIKTHKLTVFAAVLILFSILSPLTARYMAELLNWILGSDADPLTDLFGTPDVYSGYAQYLSDLFETVFFVILFVSVSIFIRDKTKGLLQLIFSKPINRTHYVISKYMSFMLMISVVTLIGYLVYSYYSYFLFDDVFFMRGLALMGLFILYIAFIASVAQFFATITKSYLAAVSITFGIYILFSVLTILGDVAVFNVLPGMILTNASNVLYDMIDTPLLVWNIITTVILTTGFLFLSIVKMKEMDIN